MKSLIQSVSAFIFTFLIGLSLQAETIGTVGRIEEIALLNNLEYKSAVLDVLKTEDALEGWLKLDDSSISLSASYLKQESEAIGYQASAILPVFEQLSFSASVNQDLSENFGIDLSPLVHSNTTAQTVLNYNQKIAQAAAIASEVAENAVESFLEWASASKVHEVQKKIVEVKKILYDDEKIRYEKAEADLDDVRDAFTAWSDSRTTLNTAFSKLQTAEAGLYATLNVVPEDYQIESPGEADLMELVKALAAKINTDELSISGSIDILNAEFSAESLELQFNSTWLFEPELKLSGDLAISQTELPKFSATAVLSFGLDDWNAFEINTLRSELDISRQQVTQVIAAAGISLKQAITASENAAINYKVAEVEMQQAKELLDEAEFLNGLGEYSAAEFEETALLYEQAQNSLFTAAAMHYTALRSLLDYSS
ncbi:MAG: TolC family protein [Spirochaetales bacterium]|nr:TolC family protein [Spirochaetales bacterium]